MTPTAQAAPPAPMTIDEFLLKHGDESNIELVRGFVVRYPMPGGPHGYICGNAGYILTSFVKQHDLGRVFTNDTFTRIKQHPDTLCGPDVAFLSYARFPKGPLPEGPLPATPDLVIEVRSPTNSIAQLTAKAGEYGVAGVTVVIVLDPGTESAAVFRGDELPQRFHNGDELSFPDVLPGFSVPVRQFFE